MSTLLQRNKLRSFASPTVASAGVPSKSLFGVITLLVFGMLVTYALLHTWEYDEAWTYQQVRHQSFWDLITYRHFNIANNHLLNSLWFRFLQELNIKSFFAYRCLSLGAFWIYSFYMQKAITYRQNWWQPRFNIYLLLFYLPPVIFFFALGRGYGLSIALFVTSLYYMKVYLAERKEKNYWLFFITGMLTSISIVSFFFLFAAMLFYTKIRTFSKKEIITVNNGITAILFVFLLWYIRYVGKTIILHDPIINGSNNLFFHGLYSSFISLLSVSPLVFPFPDFYYAFKLGPISKLLVNLSLVLPFLILFRKFLLRYTELVLLIIVTVIFFLSHALLGAKYPLDRSVLFLYYLFYIPILLHFCLSRKWIFGIPVLVMLFIGGINIAGRLFELSRPTIYSYLQTLPAQSYAISSDWPNLADEMYNDFEFGNRLNFRYLIKENEMNVALIDTAIRTEIFSAKWDYLFLQKENYQRNKQIFAKGYHIKPLLSSNFKEFYLIRRY